MTDGGAQPASAAGVVELREDVPLKSGGGIAGGGGPWCAGGPRVILACFAALSAAITLALFTQIYYGDYELVPHGGVSSDAAQCSEAGTDALKAGGRALDAAAATALCLAVTAPHRTSLDASGSLLFWEYRTAHARAPTLAEWGAGVAGGTVGAGVTSTPPPPPRLLVALAALHAAHGSLPWARVLQPAIHLARNGFEVSESLKAALVGGGAGSVVGPSAANTQGNVTSSLRRSPQLADFLESLQSNSSAELSAAWNSSGVVALSAAQATEAGGWRVYAGGAGGAAAQRALSAALGPPSAAPPTDPDDASKRVLSALQEEARRGEVEGGWPPSLSAAVATGLAVVDSEDTYVALVTGLSVPWGSGAALLEPSAAAAMTTGGAGAGWSPDEPTVSLDVAPALMVDAHVCGTRYVLGGESGAALAQAAAALAAGGDVERPRAAVLPGAALTPDAALTPNAAAVNLVRQAADALLSHADSRGGGLASRF